MNNHIFSNIFKSLKSKGILAVSGGLLAVSCGTQAVGYTETDGVYYDPSTDTLPQASVSAEGNTVGSTYSYGDDAYDRSRRYGRYGSGRYLQDKDAVSDSDWGNYAGTELQYNSWGSPFGYYQPYGFGSYFGLGYGWSSPWFGMSYSPFWYDSFYSPYYFGGYYGYNPYYYGYNPYYGYYSPYYGYGRGYGYSAPRRAVGPDGFRNSSGRSASSYNGFRTVAPNGQRVYQNSNTAQPRIGTDRPIRTMETERYRQPSTDTYRNDSGGFRNGGMDSGVRSGGYNGGGSVRSSGGFRTGGR